MKAEAKEERMERLGEVMEKLERMKVRKEEMR